jgi:hypothetical protein
MMVAVAVVTGSVQEPSRVIQTAPLSAAVVRSETVTPQPLTALTLPVIAAPRPLLPVQPWMTDRRDSRPRALPVLYASFGAMQLLDVYSTRRAISSGAHEVNPVTRTSAGSSARMLAIKAGSTVGTIFFAERFWKKNRTGSIVMMVMINGATAAIAAHNLRNAK